MNYADTNQQTRELALMTDNFQVETESRSQAVEPMTVGTILDRSLRLLPGVFGKVLVLYLCLGLLGVLGQIPATGLKGNMQAAFSMAHTIVAIIRVLLQYYLVIATTLIAHETWHGRNVSLGEVNERVSFGLGWRLFRLYVRVGVGTILWAFLFIVPGIVYAFNRILAHYILVIENTSIGYAIDKSKSLMSQEPWYRLSGPTMRISGVALLLLMVGMFSGVMVGGASYMNARGIYSRELTCLLLFLSLLVAHVVAVYSYICYLGFYHDLCARYEGKDLMSRLEQLPMDEARV